MLSGQPPRATLRNALMYRVNPDLQVGLEYNPLVDEVGPLVNYRAVRETRLRPAVIFGTSSDRIGTPAGQGYYAIVAKDLEPLVGFPVAPYISAFYGTYHNEWTMPWGARFRLAPGLAFLGQYDGHAFHELLEYSRGRYTLVGILVRSKHPGFWISRSF